MADKGIHYRQGGKLSHCGVECLPDGKDIEYIVIKSIDFKEAESVGGREEKNIWIATFEPNPYTALPMVLNSTNRKRLSKLAKTPYINLVKNFPVRLTQEECRDAQDGGMTWGLRISKLPAKKPVSSPPQKPVQSPAAKEVLNNKHQNWEKCVDYVKAGGQITDLEVRFIISEDVKEMLIDAIKPKTE